MNATFVASSVPISSVTANPVVVLAPHACNGQKCQSPCGVAAMDARPTASMNGRLEYFLRHELTLVAEAKWGAPVKKIKLLMRCRWA